MTTTRITLTSLFAAIVGTSSPAYAGGYAVSEQSTVAGGTGGASTARSDDAGAAWYNPAALADGGGVRLGLGILAAMPSIHAEAMDGTWQSDTESGVATPPHLFASYASGDLAYGVAAGVPFGGGVSWPEDWAGRHEIISSELQVFRAAPFVAWRRGKLRVAGGLHVDAARLRINRSLDFVDTEGDVFLDMDGTGIGFDASVFYRASETLDVGVSYKSRTTIDFEGGADFDAPDEFSVKTTDQRVRTQMTVPDKLTMGARWARERLAVLADLDVTLWSVNDRLVIDFERDETPDPVQTNNWSSTFGLRAGAEYLVREATLVRGGAFYDPSPASTEYLAPSSPDSNRVGVTFGASHQVEQHVTIDAFYEYMHLLGRAADNMNALEARYGGHAQMVGVGVRVTR